MPRISSAAASTRAHIPGRSHLLFITSSAEASAAQLRLTAGLSMTRLKLRHKNGTARCAAQCIVGHADKFIVKYRVFAQAAYGNSHSVFKIAFAFDLRTIIFFKIVQKLLRSAGQIQFLRTTAEAGPNIEDFLL